MQPQGRRWRVWISTRDLFAQAQHIERAIRGWRGHRLRELLSNRDKERVFMELTGIAMASGMMGQACAIVLEKTSRVIGYDPQR